MEMHTPEIEIIVHEEHIPVRGNAMASDDPDFDKQVEDKIIADFNNGNEWAWCTVEVRASFRGLTASDFLGCCSYASEEQFREPGGYFDDMVSQATEELAKQVKELQGVEIKLSLK